METETFRVIIQDAEFLNFHNRVFGPKLTVNQQPRFDNFWSWQCRYQIRGCWERMDRRDLILVKSCLGLNLSGLIRPPGHLQTLLMIIFLKWKISPERLNFDKWAFCYFCSTVDVFNYLIYKHITCVGYSTCEQLQ